MTTTVRTGSRRRWRIAASVAAIAAIGFVAFLPQVLSLGPARSLLTAEAGRILAPGSLESQAVRLSWFGPTRIVGVVLRDGEGNPLVAADRVSFDWSLWQMLFRRPDTATVKLPGADLRIARRDDGRIDLQETLRPIIRDHPERRLVVQIAGGRLQFRDPALAEPFVADRADILLDVPRDPDPIRWEVSLAREAGPGREQGRATFEAIVQGPEGGVGTTLAMDVARWPWSFTGGRARGVLDARLSAEHRDAVWSITGHATASDLATDAKGAPDAGRLGPIRAEWEIEGPPGNLTARRLELAMPYARLSGGGTIASADGIATVELKGSLAPDWDRIEADLRREVEPRARVDGRARDWRLKGTIGGPGGGDPFAHLDGELGLQFVGVDVFGLRLSETAVVVRADGGRLRIDPIDARLNEGTIHLEPEIVRPQDGPIRIKFGDATTIKDAMVNDEVSHRVLSYVAPVLDGATRVRGRVSVRGLDAEFPIGEGASAAARVEGDVLFDDVRFLPGPIAEAIMAPLPKARDARPGDQPLLVLRDPISFRIADRKVYQHGLMIPVGPVGTVGLEGSVDFERRLDLVARFRVNPPPADQPVVAALLNNARFDLPIRGTLEKPQIDEEALKERLKTLGADMLGNSVVAGAEGLLQLLDGLPKRRETRKPPADGPPAEAEPPRRPSADERKEIREQRRLERQEKKAERRKRREGQPE